MRCVWGSRLASAFVLVAAAALALVVVAAHFAPERAGVEVSWALRLILGPGR